MTAIIPSLIALAVVVVAFQQFLLAKERLKLDLFERRLAIYKAVQTYLEGVRTTQDSSDELSNSFREATQTAQFLYDSDVTDFIDELYRLGFRLNLANREVGCLNDSQLMKAKGIKTEALREFMAHHLKFDFRFLPYLKFRKWSGAFWIDFHKQHKKKKDYDTLRAELKSK